MGALVFNLTTAALMVLMFNGGLALVGRDTLRRRPSRRLCVLQFPSAPAEQSRPAPDTAARYFRAGSAETAAVIERGFEL